MANRVILTGRLTKDPEIRQTQSEEPITVARYTLAVDRYRKGGNETDFIRCVAFGRNGEFAERYLNKGMKILAEGHIQTGSYESDGRTVYTTDVVVERHEFCERKDQRRDTQDPQDQAGEFIPEEADDEDVPF